MVRQIGLTIVCAPGGLHDVIDIDRTDFYLLDLNKIAQEQCSFVSVFYHHRMVINCTTVV